MNSCDNDDFSQSYIIVYEYFSLMPKMQKIPKGVSMDNQTCFLACLFPSHVSKAKHFEPIEHNFFYQWFKNESFAL